MKIELPVISWLLSLLGIALSTTLNAQLTESRRTDTSGKKTGPATIIPEIFTNGFIDIMNNGQINASARFIRLLIGEPGKVSLPLSLYSGVSANNFQLVSTVQKSNDQLVTAFINPLSGLINLSIDGVLYFNQKKKVTRAGILYHIG